MFKKSILVFLIVTVAFFQQFVCAEEVIDDNNLQDFESKVDTNKVNLDTLLTEITLDDNSKPANYSLTIDELLNTALENNSLLNIQRKQTKILKIGVTKSKLDFLPTLQTAMNYSYNTNIVQIGKEGAIVIPQVGVVNLIGFDVQLPWMRQNTVSVTQPISEFYRLYHKKKIADLSLKKQILEEELSGQNLVLNVYNTYFDVLTTKYQLESLDKTISELKAHMETAQSKVNQGTALMRDVQVVEVDLNKAEFNRSVKQEDLKEQFDKIKYLLDLSYEDTIDIKIQDTNLSDQLLLDEAINQAIKNNIPLNQLKLNIQIAKHAKKEEYSNYIPYMNLDATYANQSGNELIPRNNLILSYNMKFNFFDWTKRELTIKEKQLQIEQAELALKDFTEKLKLDIEQDYNKIKQAERLIGVETSAVKLAESNLDISLNRYKVGFALITDVLNDQSQLATSRSNYYQALFAKQKALVKLKQTMGLLIPEK